MLQAETSFTCWLGIFKVRNSINSEKNLRESGNTTISDIGDWKTKVWNRVSRRERILCIRHVDPRVLEAYGIFDRDRARFFLNTAHINYRLLIIFTLKASSEN